MRLYQERYVQHILDASGTQRPLLGSTYISAMPRSSPYEGPSAMLRSYSYLSPSAMLGSLALAKLERLRPRAAAGYLFWVIGLLYLFKEVPPQQTFLEQAITQ